MNFHYGPLLIFQTSKKITLFSSFPPLSNRFLPIPICSIMKVAQSVYPDHSPYSNFFALPSSSPGAYNLASLP